MKLFFIFLLMMFHPVLAQAENVRQTPVVRAIQKCSPSVVNISTERVVLLRQNPVWGAYGKMLDDLHAGTLRGQVTTLKQNSLGSGVIVSADGLIVTNAHVIQMGSKIYVTLSDGKIYEAVSLGANPAQDLALIKIKPEKPLQPMDFSKDILLGETVITMGNPYGLQNSVSAGIVSGTGRRFISPAGGREMKDLIQTDAAISIGSSGGALVNLEGQLVGINLAVVQDAPNIGFAVSVEKVRTMLAEYEKIVKGQNQ